MLRMCGRHADGVLLANQASVGAIGDALASLRAGAAAAGRTPGTPRVHLRLEVSVADDPAAALAVVARRVAARLVNSYPAWDYLERLGIEATPELEQAAAAKDVAAVARRLRPEHVRSSALAGDPDSVSAQLVPLLGSGIDKVTIRPLAPAGGSVGTVVESFMQDVWPSVVAQHADRPATEVRAG